jgi:hypothetical protein
MLTLTRACPSDNCQAPTGDAGAAAATNVGTERAAKRTAAAASPVDEKTFPGAHLKSNRQPLESYQPKVYFGND